MAFFPSLTRPGACLAGEWQWHAIFQRESLALLYILWNGATWRANEGWLTSSNKCTLSGVWRDRGLVVGIAMTKTFNGNLGSEITLLTKSPEFVTVTE
jgi:hypothetical protein